MNEIYMVSGGLLGLALLYYGADFLVRGWFMRCNRWAERFRLNVAPRPPWSARDANPTEWGEERMMVVRLLERGRAN